MPKPDDPPDPWIKTTIPLPPSHGWRCKPGNHLIVADRGAASLEVPETWVVKPEKDGLCISNKTPPADEARLMLTVFHLPPVQGGWRGLPLEQMMRVPNPDGAAKALEIHRLERPGIEMVWAEKGEHPDRDSGRTIRTRQLLARANLVQVLITYDVYRDCADRFEPVWKDLLRTLRVGVSRSLMGDVGN